MIAGTPGILEILLIAVAILWLLNAFRKASILRKMEQQLDEGNKDSSSGKKKKRIQREDPDDTEDADYEVIE